MYNIFFLSPTARSKYFIIFLYIIWCDITLEVTYNEDEIFNYHIFQEKFEKPGSFVKTSFNEE